MKETSLGVWHGPCSRGSSKHGPMPHENKSRTGTPGRARQGPQSGQAACMMCVCVRSGLSGALIDARHAPRWPAALPPCRTDRSTPPCPIPRPKPVATEIRFVQKHGSVYPAVVVRNSEGRFWTSFRRSVGTLVGPSQGLCEPPHAPTRCQIKSNRVESPQNSPISCSVARRHIAQAEGKPLAFRHSPTPLSLSLSKR